MVLEVQWLAVEDDVDSIAFVGRLTSRNSFNAFSKVHELEDDSGGIWDVIEAARAVGQEGHHVDNLRVVSGVDQVL